MKRYIRSTQTNPIAIDIIFEVEITRGGPDDSKVAAVTYKGFEIPEGELLPEEKHEVVTSQQYDDYHSFIDSVEDLLVDYYHLEIYYKNKSDYESFYYGLLAKDSDGNILFDFTLTFRVSTHDAHRTKRSQARKKEQKEELHKLTPGKDVRVISKGIIVNKKRYESYFKAYEAVDNIVKDAVETMTRSSKN